MAYDADAVNCWDLTATAAATGTNAFCEYTHAYSTVSNAWTTSFWPATTYASAATLCTASTTKTCAPATTPSAALTDMPKVATCYVGTNLDSSTLAAQSATSCPASSVFCKAVFSGTTAPVTVTQSCSDTCTAGTSTACSYVASTNKVLGCYVGVYYTMTATSTFTKTVCPLVSSGTSAAFCKNSYSYTVANGITVTGTCEAAASCSYVATTGSGTTSMAGVTCSGTVYGNTYPNSSGNSIAINMLVMILSSVMGLLAIHL